MPLATSGVDYSMIQESDNTTSDNTASGYEVSSIFCMAWSSLLFSSLFPLHSLLQSRHPLVYLLERPALERRRVKEGTEIESVIIWRVGFRVIRRSRHGLLMSIDVMVMVKALDLVGDLARAQFAMATPFVEQPQEHAIRSEVVLLA